MINWSTIKRTNGQAKATLFFEVKGKAERTDAQKHSSSEDSDDI